jgi:outer membrane protein
MKLMPAVMATFSLAVTSLSQLAFAGTVAEEGHHMISAAWLHVDTSQSTSDPLRTTQVRSGATTTDTGTRTRLSNADTLALTYTYFIDDHFSAQLLGGVPPKFKLSGSGHSAMLNADLSQYGDLAEVRQWSPTALAIYTFGEPTHAFRPYVGVGVSYTRFDNIELNPAFENALIASVKSKAPAGYIQEVSVSAEADDSWDPVLTLGGQYRFAKNWYAIASVSYLPLSTTATVTTTINKTVTPAIPTGKATVSEASMDINPVVTYLGVGYRF